MIRTTFIPALVALLLAACGNDASRSAGNASPDQPPAAQAPSNAAATAPAAIELGAAIAFSNPAQCEPSPALRRVLDRMLVRDEARGNFRTGGTVSLAGLDRPLTPRLKVTPSTQEGLRMIDYESSLQLPDGARWHGLRISRLVVAYLDVDESDDQEQRSIDFLEPPATVLRVLNQRGFNVPAAPRYSELHDDACGGSMQVVAIPGGAALQCGYGC